MTEVTKSKSFEERMKDRIRDSIGDLLTDEDLSKLVNKGLEDVFFKSVTVSDGWNSTKTSPPYMHSIVKELLEPTVRKVADAWVNEHKEEVLKVIDAVISEGMAKALLRAIDTKFQNDLFNLQIGIQNNLQSLVKIN